VINQNINTYCKYAIEKLSSLYDKTEATAIIEQLILNLFMIKPHQIVYLNKDLTENEIKKLDEIMYQLLAGKPIQYILGESHFGPYTLIVNKHVLIPRQETYELTAWLIEDHKNKHDLKILDVGTGSGCISVLLADGLKSPDIIAIDKSDEALKVAKQNAKRYNTQIKFLELDILNTTNNELPQKIDIIVSNPPYIKQSEILEMHSNVVQYEPKDALFVTDEDPLIFYSKIADIGLSNLNIGGFIYVEINQKLGNSVKELFINSGYKNVELRTDINGNDRMIRAQRL
jgi:release factor glutamine methyltransferase